MKRYALLSLSLLMLGFIATSSSLRAQPQPRSFGFGIIIGEPTGLTLKGSLSGNNSWDAGIGTSFFGRLRIHADYLWAANVFHSRTAGMYFGLGGAVAFGRGRGVFYASDSKKWYYYNDENAVAFAVRGSAGINVMLTSAPVEFFGEIAPLIGIAPTTGLGWDVAVGVRYYP